jgi:PEP-CTERM motif-containing protein
MAGGILMRVILSSLACLSILIVSRQYAQARLIAYDFTATVQSVDTSELTTLGISVSIGDTMTGSFAYDPANSTADGFPANPNQGAYGFDVPPSSMSYTVGGYTFTADSTLLGGYPFPNPDFFVGPLNDVSGVDTLSIGSGSKVGARNVETNIRLFDTTASVFSDDSLPTSYSDQDFDSSLIRLFRIDTFAFTVFTAELDTLTESTAIVPEPSAFIIMGVGLISIMRRSLSRRNKGRRRNKALSYGNLHFDKSASAPR